MRGGHLGDLWPVGSALGFGLTDVLPERGAEQLECLSLRWRGLGEELDARLALAGGGLLFQVVLGKQRQMVQPGPEAECGRAVRGFARARLLQRGR